MKSTAYYIDTRTEITRDFVSRSDVDRRGLGAADPLRYYAPRRGGERRSKFNQTPRALI
jgi:hypothetical protein